jgi:DNA primase
MMSLHDGCPLADERVSVAKQVKEANDIVTVLGGYLAVHPAGSSFKALCPFHKDTRPSLQIDPKWQNFRCWACGKKGDVFTFIQEMEKVDFPEALQILADRAGIKLGRVQRNEGRLRLLETMKWAAQVYQNCLLESPLAEQARIYLGERKLTGATVRNFGLGFAPLEGDWFIQEARRAGKNFDTLVELGLIAETNEGKGFYERFRDRVMFPIRDVRGQTVGFGGRILPNSPYASRAPKYYNSTETPLFQKSELLYGLDAARHAAASAGYLAVVEGYTDVLMAHQHGVCQVVATMGTALNARHVHQLRRFVSRVVLVFDADAGGLTGVDRALELFVSQDVELAIAALPDQLDPCDLLVEQGPEPFRQVLAGAVDALDFKLTRLLSQDSAQTPAGQKRAVDAVLGIMALAPTMPGSEGRVKQELLVTRLAHRLGLRQETVWARFGELRAARKKEVARTAPETAEPSSVLAPEPEPHLERQLLTLLLVEPAFVPQAAREVTPDQFEHDGTRRLLNGLYQLQAAGERADLDGLRTKISDPGLIARALELHDVGRTLGDRPRWFRVILEKFRQRRAEPERRQLRDQLAATSNHEAAVELLRKLQNPTEGSGP